MRNRISTGVVAMALALLAIAPATASAKEATVTKADVKLALAEDASLIVHEFLTVEYDGDFEATYRDINFNFGEKVRDVSIKQVGENEAYEPGGCTTFGCYDRDHTFGVEKQGDGIRIVWHHGLADTTATFDLAYRVTGAAVAYDDVIDVAWQVWGDEWDQGLAELDSSFSDRALEVDNTAYRVWGYPREVEGETARGEGIATLQATDIPPHQYVAIRVLVPRVPGENVSGARIESGNGLEKILAEEEAKDDDYSQSWARAERFLGTNTAPVLGGLGALMALLFGGLLLFARERRTPTPTYLSGPPDPNVSPALAYAYAHEGGDSNDTVLATLLDLVDRGYYTAKAAQGEDEEQDLAIQAAPNRPPTETLESHEAVVLDFFDKLIDGNEVPLSKMKDRVPEHSATWRERWATMTAALNGVEGDEITWDRNLIWVKWVAFVVFEAILALVTIAYASVYGTVLLPLAIGIPISLIIFFFPHKRLKRLDPENRKKNAEWAAFAKWTDDFPRLDDDPPATLDLWKRIIVFGVAFGTAERMIESGRIPVPSAPPEPGSSGMWGYYAMSGGLHHDSFSGSSFGSSFSSHVAPESSSSGGGGGFSGGGGGSSGGGGGGSW